MVISTDTNGFLWLLLFLSCMTLKVESSIKCPPFFPCGDVGNISFPFTTKSHPECGALVIYGCDDDYAPGARKSILNNDRWFDIVTLNQSSITVRDDRLLYLLLSRSCDVLGYNSTFWVNSPLASSQLMRSAYVLRCNNPLTINSKLSEILSNHTLCGSHTFYEVVARIQESDYLTLVTYYSSYYNLTGCTLIQLPFLGPVIANGFISDLVNYSLAADISIQITLSPNCSDCRTVYGGQCRIDNYGKFFCDKGETGGRKIVLIAVCSAAAGALGVLILLGWCFRRCFCSKAKPSEEIIEMFLKDHGHLAAKKYSYLEVKKATNSFKDKIGQGGYGSVYKGKLSDGTFVAVKVLSESKGDGEEFINEVASISVTSHVNIVQLLGFCLEGSKRALIYKYMPNGSVEKFIYKDKDPLKFSPQLSCKTMYKIAIGVARGLDYLHKGCNSKIVHFDIKPHNILLDEDFCPKISDFGLAKICTRKDSILSLLDARGTIGYIAPEVFSRNFGGVSHKSDVYSYGMMVLEIIGGRKNINIKEETDVERSSEVYFPHWIYKRLNLHEDLGLRCIKNELDKEMIHKMIIVSLWCIQTDPTNRPRMSKVVDMMESDLESLQMPPKPYLSSPPRSPARLLSDSSHSDM